MPITFRYKVSALDFIDKALDEEHFSERVESAIEYTLEKLGATGIGGFLSVLKRPWPECRFLFIKILYFESSPTVHKVILHTKEERIEFYAGLSDLEKADSRTVPMPPFLCSQSGEYCED